MLRTETYFQDLVGSSVLGCVYIWVLDVRREFWRCARGCFFFGGGQPASPELSEINDSLSSFSGIFKVVVAWLLDFERERKKKEKKIEAKRKEGVLRP